jgi:hypothetical protein
MTNIPGPRTKPALALASALLALALAAQPVSAQAQEYEYIVEPIVDATITGDEDGFSQAELDQMLAPIALYPDALLSQVLIAATYPLEIVEAARWSRRNPHLQGEDAVNAVADRDWDPSVKALVAFPDLLARLDEDLEWTRRLGDAVLYQEAQVMDSVQFLRARADAAGTLSSNEYTQVIREKETIIIQPTQTRVVHVPYYDPYLVYGGWWRPAYPPVVWVAPSHYYYGYPGYYWSSGIHISSGFFFSSFYWPQRSVVIVSTPRYYHPGYYPGYRSYYEPGQRWRHNPRHRHGVDYRHAAVRERYWGPNANPPRPNRWDRDPRRSGDGSFTRDTRHSGGLSPRTRTSLSGTLSGDADRQTGTERRIREDERNRSLSDRARSSVDRSSERERSGEHDRSSNEGTRSFSDRARASVQGDAPLGRAAPAARAPTTGRPDTTVRGLSGNTAGIRAPQSTRQSAAPTAPAPRALAAQARESQIRAPRASAPQASAPQTSAPPASAPPSAGLASRARSAVQSSPAPAASAEPAPQSRASRGDSGNSQAGSGFSQRASRFGGQNRRHD